MPQRFILFKSRLWPDGVSRVAAGIAVLIGVGALIGWVIDSPFLISISPKFIAILPLTAAGLAAGGAAILLMWMNKPQALLAARALAIAFLTLGVLSLISRVAGRDLFGMGQVFHDALATHPYRPLGVMATNSTIVMTLTGIALLLVSSARARLRHLGRALAILAGAITSVAVLGHLYNAPRLYTFDQYAGMALLTALGFASVQIGVIFLKPADDGISLLTGPDLAAVVMRRMLPLVIGFPILVGVLWIRARETDFFSRETGVALVATSVSFWMLLLLIYNSRFIREADAQRAALFESERQAREAAESASKAKSDFLAVMSHELRTPLNAIMGYVGILKDDISGPLNELQRRNLKRIGESAQHLTNVVNDILMLARLEAGKEAARQELVFLPKLLDEVSAILEPLAKAKSLVFTCDCEAMLSVFSDAHMLKQILINLGGNAVKFTHQGEVHLRSRVDGDRVVVSVTDTGIGIAPENLGRVFEQFWQVEQALTRNIGGAGLGLTVSRHLARRLGGDITVESAIGKGSTFSLMIPATIVSALPATTSASDLVS